MQESPRRYKNPFLSDEENDKVNLWSNKEPEHSSVGDDFTNNCENEKFKNSIAPCDVPSESFEKATGFYTDKHVMECELPELVPFHVVKDICVDEGHNSSQAKECEEDAIKENGTKETVAIDSIKNVPKDDSDGNGPSKGDHNELILPVESCIVQNSINGGQDNSMQTGEEKINSSANLLDEAFKEQLVSNILPLQQDRPLTSLKFLLESSKGGVLDVDQQPSQSSPEEISKKSLVQSETEELGTSGQTTNSEENIVLKSDNQNPERPEDVNELSPETPNASSNHRYVAMADHLQHNEGESSFSMAGGLITNSGPIPFSGSISLRSDSSTTSTRSFAFPVLQTEWNSSPVRMAKADRRRLRKHGGCWHGLLCRRF